MTHYCSFRKTYGSGTWRGRQVMATAYRLTPVQTLGPAAVDDIRRIYESGFAPHLRAGFDSITSHREPGELGFALLQDGQPRGFAMLRPLGATGWIFLRYFVVEEGQRGRGLGGILWRHVTARLRDLGYTLLVFDVEDPDEPDCGEDEVRIRNRRIGFYLRQGAHLLPVSGYRTPHGSAEDPGWTPMRLMSAPLTAGQPVSVVPAGEIVSAVYRYRWLLAPDHPQVRRTSVADPARRLA
jgi:GNAT superfamily N-acetyltransferase